jgi:hypothetical protein
MHPLLLDELAAARVDDLRRQARRERLGLSVRRRSPAATVARRSLRTFGFLLVGAGLRLALAGEGPRQAGRSVG